MRETFSVTINELNEVLYNANYKHLKSPLNKSEFIVLQGIGTCDHIISS